MSKNIIFVLSISYHSRSTEIQSLSSTHPHTIHIPILIKSGTITRAGTLHASAIKTQACNDGPFCSYHNMLQTFNSGSLIVCSDW
jgi:hypothetical protein